MINLYNHPIDLSPQDKLVCVGRYLDGFRFVEILLVSGNDIVLNFYRHPPRSISIGAKLVAITPSICL
jgi:hypothetical protein